LPATAEISVGAPGTVAGATGVTESEAAEGSPRPIALPALTVKEYGVPFKRFSTTHDVEGVLQACPRPSVTEYVVMGEPPSEDGAVHDTVTWPSPATTEVIVGAPGTVNGATGVAESETAEDAPVPTAFVAVTANE